MAMLAFNNSAKGMTPWPKFTTMTPIGNGATMRKYNYTVPGETPIPHFTVVTPGTVPNSAPRLPFKPLPGTSGGGGGGTIGYPI